ncbi:MAG: hypothetical protein IJE83_02720 [Oscillospiraceae bacterium]|nr:hypothetical protein [Oscillospiraceae bacterium]MBQ3236218.1 hypothetical protein [Oscillospiraceae bacterium]MBQ6700379.1 hypothetical protein [Oscillospiraceae bacterium]
MKTEEFIKAFGEIKPEYIDEAAETKRKNITPFKKWIAAAACIAIIASCTTAILAAANVITFAGSHDTTVVGRFGKVKSATGYDVKMKLESIAKDEINTDISLGRNFYKVSDALEYLGCDKIEIPDLGLHQGVTGVYLTDSPKGKSFDLEVYSSYQGDGINFHTTAYAKIEDTAGTEFVYFDEFSAAGENIKYSEEYFVNDNGIEYMVVRSDTVEDYYNETMNKDQKQKDVYLNAYLVKNGVAYTFSCTIRKVYDEKDPWATQIYDEMIFRDEDNAKYEVYLHKWANSF